MAELVAADLKSRYPVLAVLTDLQAHWQFFFFGEGKSSLLPEIELLHYCEMNYLQIIERIQVKQNKNYQEEKSL